MYEPFAALPLGQRIRALRIEKGMTQHELAAGSWSASYISAVELGRICPSMRALTIIAERLEVSMSQLLGEGEYLDLYIEEDAQIAIAIARYYLLAGDLEQANKLAAQVSEPLLSVGERHHLHLLRVEIHLALGDTLGAEVLLAHARAKLANYQDKLVLAYAHYLQARLAWEMGRPDVAASEAREALSLIRADKAGDIHLAMRILVLYQQALLVRDPAAARALHAEMMTLAEIVADARQLAACYYQSATAARQQHNPTQALAELSRAEGIIEWGQGCKGQGASCIGAGGEQ